MFYRLEFFFFPIELKTSDDKIFDILRPNFMKFRILVKQTCQNMISIYQQLPFFFPSLFVHFSKVY